MKKPDCIEFAPGAVEFQCPQCGGKVMAGATTVDENTMAVSHTMPMCRRFEHLQPDDYLQWCREQLEARQVLH